MKPFIKPPPATPPAGAAPASARISPNELTIFSVAASVTDPAERAAFLDRACGTDGELRARLDERLNARSRQAAAPTPNTPAIAAPKEVTRTIREGALYDKDRPDAMALVPMSAAHFAAAQQPPRHSPIPWAMATFLAVAVGALAVFLFTERNSRVQAEAAAKTALQERAEADRERQTAAAAVLEAKTVAQRSEESVKSAVQEKETAAAEATKAKAEAEKQRIEREQALATAKLANEKAQAAEAEVVKLRAQAAAGQRANQLALADSLARLGAAQMDARAYGDAEASLRQALQLRTQLQADPWSIVENRALMGSALMQKNQDAEALQEIQTAATAFEALGAPMTDADRGRATAASKRIVHFFTVTGRRKDATEWRRRLDAVLAVQ